MNSAFYAWQQSPQSNHELKDEELKSKIGELFAQGKGAYGSPRITEALGKQSIAVSRKRVARIMRNEGLRASGKRKFKHTTDSDHPLPMAPNRLNQQFQVAGANQVWVGDITYIRTHEGWSYLTHGYGPIFPKSSRLELLRPNDSEVGMRRAGCSRANSPSQTRANFPQRSR